MSRVRREDGFTMPLVLAVLIVTLLLGVAAFQSARGDIGTSAASRDRKQAYAAAESGLSWYAARLAKDNAFWTRCDTVGAPVSKEFKDNATVDPRRYKALPGSTARYSVELLAAGSTGTDTKQCDPSKPDANLLAADGTFRIRATGTYNGVTRAIVATLRRARFLDFLYFTDYETTDPLTYTGTINGGSAQTYANNYCGEGPNGEPRYRVTRDKAPSRACREIQFGPEDEINGPLHSNDSLLICGGATFGRNGGDEITTAQNEPSSVPNYGGPGWRRGTSSSCTGGPSFASPIRTGQARLPLPATNRGIKDDAAAAGYVFTGTTRIVLNATSITVYNNAFTTANKSRTMAWPTNGLIYVDTRTAAPGSTGCGTTQLPATQTYTEPDGCANVYVRGSYGKDITVASAKDVIVDGDLTRSGTADTTAGLIADNFVRLWHPVNRSNCSQDSANTVLTSSSAPLPANPGAVLKTVTIEAAILSLAHTFTVDNHDCGTGLGDLKITGAIAQKYRGPVGLVGAIGYTKNYNYDDRLLYRNPPFFLTPVNAAWRIMQSNEDFVVRPAG